MDEVGLGHVRMWETESRAEFAMLPKWRHYENSSSNAVALENGGGAAAGRTSRRAGRYARVSAFALGHPDFLAYPFADGNFCHHSDAECCEAVNTARDSPGPRFPLSSKPG